MDTTSILTEGGVDLHRSESPVALEYREEGSALHIGVPVSEGPAELSIRYQYRLHEDFNGVSARGLTFTWPYYCGNLFPCKSEPSEGQIFELEIVGAEAQAVYPRYVPAQGPAYMLAWAIGDYQYVDLGATAAGTRVGVWHLPQEEQDAHEGTRHLRGAFEWFERTLGPYTFGHEVASVSAHWEAGTFGGMEHHPYWHVSSESLADPEVHVHEAAHGWFGNGVRLSCWEDFVLSEGLATYLAARALEAVAGPTAGTELWQRYATRLRVLQSGTGNRVAWLQGCGVVDILQDGLYSDAPYIKGAYFFRSLEEEVGRPALDGALADFYSRHVGESAGMQDFIDVFGAFTGFDANDCATAWLRREDAPESTGCP